MRIFSVILLVCWAKIAPARISCENGDNGPSLRSGRLQAAGSLVINEIFAVPNSNLQLPAQEFIELWNPTADTVLMQGWSFSDLRSKVILAADTLPPGGFLLICSKTDLPAVRRFGRAQGLSPWPALNNDEDVLMLTNPNGELADQVHYKADWYQGTQAAGRSLERIVAHGPCTGFQNWMASTDPVGMTAGAVNSVAGRHEQNPPVEMQAAALAGDSTIRLIFSAAPDTATALRPGNYLLNNGMGAPLTTSFIPGSFSGVLLRFSSRLPRNRHYLVSAPGVRDCAGRAIVSSGIELFVSDTPATGDLLISELLCNPRSGGVDFVEIYNASGRTMDLAGIYLARADTLGRPADLRALADSQLLMGPQSYRAFTTSATTLLAHYSQAPPAQLSQVARLPAYFNEKGSVILMHKTQVLDRLDYLAELHHPLLKDQKGVSLERADFSQPANAPHNFGSGSSVTGYATPGYRNSRQAGNSLRNQLALELGTFSPDGDGLEDVLPVAYQLDRPDYLATLTIYSDKGIRVRQLLRNELAGSSGRLGWDGTDETGRASPAGIYLLHFSAFSPAGNRYSTHKACVLARKLE